MAEASTAQLLQEQRQEIQAQESSRAQHRRLQASGRESLTPAGCAMVREHGDRVCAALELLLAKWGARPQMAGPHYCALPLLLHLERGGAEAVITVALPMVIDGISRPRDHRALAIAIGKAFEEETRGTALAQEREGTLRLMKRRCPKRITDLKTLASMAIERNRWTAADRFEIGALLIDLIVGATGLIELVAVQRGRRAGLDVRPTAEALARLKAWPMRQQPTKRLPMLEPPRPWQGMEGGGHRTNHRPLVAQAPHLAGEQLVLQIGVVNQLQRQRIGVDAGMVELQRQAWDHGIEGLFPVQREPLMPPPRPTERVGAEAFRAWQQQVLDAKRDQQEGRALRLRIERSLKTLNTLAPGPCWFAYELDWRGRIYTANREATHQGPDWEKAALQLEGPEAGATGFEWMLRAAAGHWGIRGTWGERLQWAKDNLDLLTGAAEAPLERLELWRDAKDPWQFLQQCRGIRSWLLNPAKPIGCPIRLDQHASGMAIIAALCRDGRLAAATRLTGDKPVDLYQLVADAVTDQLREDHATGPLHIRRHAAQWLELGITRSLAKVPTMTSVYGAGFWSCADFLALELEAQIGPLQPNQFEARLVAPSQHLARVFGAVLKDQLATCYAMRDWLQGISRTVVATGQPVRWTTPMGMPVELGRELERRAKVSTTVSGSRRWAATRATPGELSARATARGITANLIHSFDGAFCQRVVCTAGEQGIQLLTNHDCFAVAPAHAEVMHRMLHLELGGLFRTSWLPRAAREIASRAGVAVAPPPMVGSLRVSGIGQNPYAFS